MSETNTLQVYSVYINASAQQVWDAITLPEHTARWGHGGAAEYDLSPNGAFRLLSTPGMRAMGLGDVAVSGTVVKADPPKLLVLDWLPAWHAEAKPTRVTWELTAYPDDVTKVVLTHDVSAAPDLADEFAGGSDPGQGGGGWPWALSDLKSMLETGSAMAGEPA